MVEDINCKYHFFNITKFQLCHYTVNRILLTLSTQYFTYSWGSPLWTDFNQILHIRRYARYNHLCKFWYGTIEGFGKYGGQSLGSPIETTGHPYNSAGLPHSMWYRFCVVLGTFAENGGITDHFLWTAATEGRFPLSVYTMRFACVICALLSSAFVEPGGI